VNRKRQELIDRMSAFPAEEGEPRRDAWERFAGRGGLCARYMQELDTPEWVTPRQWPDSRYRRHVSITLAHPGAKPIIRHALAPWVDARDSDATLERALAILDDPAGELERR
jgi:hypothetical protein